MDKPIILVEQDLKEDISNLLNTYLPKLPISVIMSTLQDAVVLCGDIHTKQYESAKSQYEQALASEEEMTDGRREES